MARQIFCMLSANLAQGSQDLPAPTSGIFPAFGTTTVTAVYSGDSSSILQRPPTPSSRQSTQDITTATVTSSLTPAPFRQAVTFTANVQGNSRRRRRCQVMFLDGGALLGAATLDPTGHATFTTSTLIPRDAPHPGRLPGLDKLQSNHVSNFAAGHSSPRVADPAPASPSP